MTHCFYDGFESSSTFTFPLTYDDTRRLWTLSPLVFCSPACTKAYLLQSSVHEEHLVLFHLYCQEKNIPFPIQSAPRRERLRVYNHDQAADGLLDIRQFRASPAPCANPHPGMDLNIFQQVAQSTYLPLVVDRTVGVDNTVYHRIES
jgi:hypothetical protein